MSVTRKPYRGKSGINPRTYVGRDFARGMFYSEMFDAEERGRQMAVLKMLADPTSRKRVEDTFGIAFTRSRYPEAYAKL